MKTKTEHEHWLDSADRELNRLEAMADEDPKRFYGTSMSDMSGRLSELEFIKLRLDVLHRHPAAKG